MNRNIRKKSLIEKRLTAMVSAHDAMVRSVRDQHNAIAAWVTKAVAVYRNGGKILLFGNGGSAADAQHWATELACRYKINRRSLPAIALTTDTSLLTAIANDFSFEDIFSRQIEALATPKDMAVGLSTSGNSPNVLNAIKAAKKIGAVTVGLTSMKDTKLHRLADLCITIASTETARIQEGHELAGHMFCELVEELMFKKG
jgi:D-sedoheptulose 7-phosphate isomerase